jgi:processive 1,2-diacylglycerol beta-glucosyltransferase
MEYRTSAGAGPRTDITPSRLIMATLRDKESGTTLGVVSEADLEFLIQQLEETSVSDTDYYVDDATVEMLEVAGAAPALITLLRNALVGREGLEVQWSRD